MEAIERFFAEVAAVEFGGPADERHVRLEAMRMLAYNDLAADRNVVAVTQSLEAILHRHAMGEPGGYVQINGGKAGLELWTPRGAESVILYPGRV